MLQEYDETVKFMGYEWAAETACSIASACALSE